MELAILIISAIGTLVFAISGALLAMRHRFDPFGVFIIAFVTALGGGTLRDVLLKDREVFWLQEYWHIYIILAGTVIAMMFRPTLRRLNKPLLFFDALGLGLFTVVGTQIGMAYGLSYVNCILLGTLTGTFGGVIRDMMVNEVPVIFRKEIYATVSIGGAGVYVLLSEFDFPNPYRQLLPMGLMILARLVVIRKNVQLPPVYPHTKKKTGKK